MQRARDPRFEQVPMKLASAQQLVVEPGKLALCNKSVCGLVKQCRRVRYVADAMKGAKSSRPEDWHFRPGVRGKLPGPSRMGLRRWSACRRSCNSDPPSAKPTLLAGLLPNDWPGAPRGPLRRPPGSRGGPTVRP
eukprot:4922758-Alexandrium_andersonii.AAC.1